MENTTIYVSVYFYANAKGNPLLNNIWIEIRDSPIFSCAEKKICLSLNYDRKLPINHYTDKAIAQYKDTFNIQ